MNDKNIIVRGARVHNLKNVNIEIPRNKLTVITGLSGSGKSSLAFDTIYAEGQRRYMESLSSYARQFVGAIDKPDVDLIDGLSPTIAINQRRLSNNPRSTVGTLTEIYDYLRVVFSAIGKPHCPVCDIQITKFGAEKIISIVLEKIQTENYHLLSPIISNQKGEHKHVFKELFQNKYKQVRVDGKIYSIQEALGLNLNKNIKHSIDIFINDVLTKEYDKKKVHKMVKLSLDLGNGFVILLDENLEKEIFLSQYYSCCKCGFTMPKIEPRIFSFNSPLGACKFCMGLGNRLVVDPMLVIPNKSLSILEGAIRPWSKVFSNKAVNFEKLEKLSLKYNFSLNVQVSKLKQIHLDKILYGEGDFEGVINNLENRYKTASSDYLRKEIKKNMRELVCSQCDGKRLSPEILKITVASFSISDLVGFNLIKLEKIITCLMNKKVEEGLVKSKLTERELKIINQALLYISKRLNYLKQVGLGYLTLNRPVTSLSGGELQRIRLAVQLGSEMMGLIYILDEPSIGLHQRDNLQLIKTLKNLRDLGNTVIVVEHDETIIRESDFVIDVGPEAGERGGRIVAQGTPKEIVENKKSLTGKYLSKTVSIKKLNKYREGNKKELVVKGVCANNIKNIDAHIPLGKLVCISGVSGSGKSTLVQEVLAKALSVHFYRSKNFPAKHDSIEGLENIDKLINIDQSPIGRTPRSNPATYTNMFSYIRDLFVEIPEAKIKRYKAGFFSFNVRGGRCEHCQGEGMVKIDMQFLQDIYMECPECLGKRYNKEALSIYYNNKNIADILEMSIEEARMFFRNIPVIYDKINTLYEVGLGYLTLGQSATTLSGGEAQRIKLATELSRRATGKTLYILDEPTTGLHFEDTKRLLLLLNKLVDKGNTVLVIEHNLDVIKSSDWIIDLGPEGGDKGGEIVAVGTPVMVAKEKRSYTGKFLKNIL